MMFELAQLRCFVAVAAELHFGRAAARLNMSQPPLSRQIQALEDAVGVELLARTSRSVRLTSAGQAFLVEARLLLQRAEAATQAARRAAGQPAGNVALGFIGAATYAVLPRLLVRARAELPGVRLAVTELLTVDQMEALASRRIDIGLVRLPTDHRRVEAMPVESETLLLAVAEGQALATRPRPRLADLHQYPYIMYTPGEGWYLHDILTALFRENGVVPDYVQHVSQTHAVLSLVSAGLGAALVPASARHAAPDGVVFRHLPLPANATARLHAVWRADNDNPALPPLRTVLQRLMGPAEA
jgi:DNA-binding transcriptional LysR family regulator